MYYKPRVDDELLAQHAEGLICLSSCLAGQLPYLLLQGRKREAEEHARKYRALFGVDNYFIEVQDHGLDEEKKVAPLLIELACRLGIPLVVTNDVHYAEQEDSVAQDILLCIGTKKNRSDPNRLKFKTDEFYLKSSEKMAQLFPHYPEMVLNTVRIAQRCNVRIPQPGPLLPLYQIPHEFSSKEHYIRHLVHRGLYDRYAVVSEEIKARADYELDVIVRMDFVGYFLIVWDFITWAKEHDIPVGPGRGSGASSIVAYALKITDIDPLRYKLLFERFMNPERISMPDFDIDFCFERRQEVIEYVRARYGNDNVGQIITFGTLKPKAAIRDVGRVLDIPLSEVLMITKLMPDDPKLTFKKAYESEQLAQMKQEPRYAELFQIAEKLEDTNRNTSLHAAGIVIGKTALTDYVPLYKDSKTGKISTQFGMDLIEDCGLVKMDFLGLKTLTLIQRTQNLVRRKGGKYTTFSISDISDQDPTTFSMLAEGKSAAVFQFESRGMQGILKRAKPSKMEDLIALNALYRPGPMAFIDQYIESKRDPGKIKYPDPCLEDILSETYGVIVYQEQVMQVAQRIAGFSLGEADILRRAMGKKKLAVMQEKKKEFAERAEKQGFDKKHAENIFEILIPFAGYGFNKSHATAYSVVAYQTAFLKANFPAEFMAANLSNEINSAEKLPLYMAEAEKMGLSIQKPDVNASEPYFSVCEGCIVYGLLGIKGLGEQVAFDVFDERIRNGPYTSFVEVLDRVPATSLNKKNAEIMIKAGCFDRFGVTRASLTAHLDDAMKYVARKKAVTSSRQASLFDETDLGECSEYTFPVMEEWSQRERLRIEKELMGYYISGHPLDEYRSVIGEKATLDLGHIENARSENKYLIVGVLNAIHPYTTKSGKNMAFGSFEDLHGSVDIVVFPVLWEEHRAQFLPETIMGLVGTVDFSKETPAFLVDSVIDLEQLRFAQVKTILAGSEHRRVSSGEKTPLQKRGVSQEVHIEVSSHVRAHAQFKSLYEILSAHTGGSGEVFLHMHVDDRTYVVYVPSCKVSATEVFAQQLKGNESFVQILKECVQ